MEWEIRVPIFKNSAILKQLGLALGIPFGIVVLVIVLTSGGSVYTLYALGLIGALLFFSWLFIMAVYGGEYEAEFILDDREVCCRAQAKQAKKNRIVNGLTVVLGLLSGKPAAAGAGMLAGSRQSVYLRWQSHISHTIYTRIRSLFSRPRCLKKPFTKSNEKHQ